MSNCCLWIRDETIFLYRTVTVGNGDNYTRYLTLFTLSVSGIYIEVNLKDQMWFCPFVSPKSLRRQKCRWEEFSRLDVLLKKLVMRNWSGIRLGTAGDRRWWWIWVGHMRNWSGIRLGTAGDRRCDGYEWVSVPYRKEIFFNRSQRTLRHIVFELQCTADFKSRITIWFFIT